MNAERWKHVERLFQSVLDLPSDERDEFLKRNCAHDEQLEAEVRSLLAAHVRADRFLGAPAVDQAARELAAERLDDAVEAGGDPLIGQTLSHYRIVDKLGGGGMGVVYKAEDARLQRFVALKFLSPDLANSREALSRFRREARASSALNHPNICTVHDIGEQGSRAFFVMEFLDGTTVKHRIDSGQLEVDAVIGLAIQITDALEAAHAAGIVHRDIKPANLYVTSHGDAKILDFGLATIRPTGSLDHTAVTRTGALTNPGSAVGTVAYMSPEQVRGQNVDARSDLFSFGVVLYEMVTGTKPFLGETPGLIFDAILNRTPTPAAQVKPELPSGLNRIIARCLEKDCELRYQHAGEIRSDLQRLRQDRQTGRLRAGMTEHRPTLTRRAVWLSLAAAVVVAGALAGALYGRRPAVLTDKDTIVLADFTNTTGDPVFDDTLRQGLAVQLQESPFLSLISDQHIQRTLRSMNQPADAQLTPAIAHDICVRTGSAAVLQGSIAMLGSQYVLGLRATSCTTDDILPDEQARAARKEDVLGALSQMAIRFRTRIGESLSTIEKHSTPFQEATTPSLEAWQAYSTGWRWLISAGWIRALPLFERAVEIDPGFALAHAQVGFGYSVIGESALGRQSLRKAYQFRDRASEVERFFIDTLYDRDVTGNLEREQRTLETWAATYPRDARPHGVISGIALSSTGQYELAIAEAEKAIALNPDLTPAYMNKAINQLYLNRLDDAVLTLGRAKARKLESPEWFLLVPYFVAFLNGADEELRHLATAGRKIPLMEEIISHLEALALARAGRLQDARRVSAISVEVVQRSGRRERAGLLQAATAVWEAFYGNTAAAGQSAARALELGRGRDVDYAAAFALALSGDLPRSQALADDLAREFPEDTFVQLMYLPTLRALSSLNTHDPAAGIEALQIASRYDLALGGLGFIGRFGGLYPIYVRGKAYLEANQPAAAVAEFTRILDHRSIVLVDPMEAMARLQLARALVLSGEPAKAKRVYEDLLALWKDADPDIRLLEEARTEYARLP